jgi:serine/threonine protein kinase
VLLVLQNVEPFRTFDFPSEDMVYHPTVDSESAAGTPDGPLDYDMLFYLAELIECSGNLVRNVPQRMLLSTLIDETKQRFPIKSNSGGTSQVFVVESADFLEAAGRHLPANPLPKTIAVKLRIPKTSSDSRYPWRPLKSLCAELRILTDSGMRDHPNIVKLLGNCWQMTEDAQNSILPAMIFEATALGDLQTYHDQHPELTLGLQLQLGLGVTRGVVCLHEAGIIHCDIKPKNVLVFPQDYPNMPVIAKLIDFDNAVLYQDAPEQIMPPKGTPLWSSPEQLEDQGQINKDSLFRIDVFSLGMVLLNLLTSNFLYQYIDTFGREGAEKITLGMTLHQFKRTGTLAINARTLLLKFANISGPKGSSDGSSPFRLLQVRASKLLTKALDGNLEGRIGSAIEVAQELERLLQEAKHAKLLDYYNEGALLTSNRTGDLAFYPSGVSIFLRKDERC